MAAARRSTFRSTGRRPARFAVAGVALAVGLAGCGGGGPDVADDPEAALRDAIEELADYDGIELTFGLAADEAARAQAREEEELSAEELDRLLSARVVLRATGDEEDASLETVVTIDGTAVAELRVLPETDLYLRVDTDELVAMFDDPEIEQQLDEVVGQAAVFGLGDAAQALRNGDWIQLTGVEQLLNLFAGAQPSEPEDDEETERLAEELSAALDRFVAQDVEVTYVGEEDAGERVRATTDGASLQRFLDDVERIVSSSDAVAGQLPAEGLTDDLDTIDEDATVSVDAWLDGGRLSQVALDIGALQDTDDLDGEVLLVVGIEEFTGSIGAPDEATSVDLFEIVGSFMGMGDGFELGENPFAEEDGFFDEDAFDEDAFDEDDAFEEDGVEDDAATDDGAFEEDAFDEDGFEGDFCLEESEIEELRGELSPEEQEELDQAIELGVLPVC
jgi:hypothetical protein